MEQDKCTQCKGYKWKRGKVNHVEKEKQVNCTQCNGHYVIREGEYGLFAGCTNYPKCKSTLKVPDLIAQFFKVQGVNIYGWGKNCWKCKKTTKVYSYFLAYEIAEIFGTFGDEIGLGDIPYLDNILMKKYPNIHPRYSKTTGNSCPANICEHCGVLQGRNYVVDDPHEIIWDLSSNDDSMEKYLVETLPIESIDEFKKDIKKFF